MRDTQVRHRRRGHQESAAPGLPTAAAAPRTARVGLTPTRAESAEGAANITPCVTRAVWPCRPGRSIRTKNDLIEVDVNIELLAKSLGVMQPWETLATSPRAR